MNVVKFLFSNFTAKAKMFIVTAKYSNKYNGELVELESNIFANKYDAEIVKLLWTGMYSEDYYEIESELVELTDN